MALPVYCQFKHIPSKKDGDQIASNIETFVHAKIFDKKGIKNCGEDGNGTIRFTLTREEANQLRDKLSKVLPNENSPVWFNILSDPLDSLIPRSLISTTDDRHQGSTFTASCQFGSLRSYNQFYSHVPFDKKVVRILFRPASSPDSLHIEFDDIRLVIPFDSIQKKNILVNKENARNYGVYILISLKYTPYVYRLVPLKYVNKANQTSDKKQIRICDDDQHVRYIRDLAYSSDVVFHFPPSQDIPWLFLNYFLIDRPEQYEINFSVFTISDWSKVNNKNQKPDPFDYKNASFQDRYALHMLTSLGFVFRDKWAQLTDEQLNWNKWNINERYTLCCFAVEQLCKDHGYDLTRTERDYDETRKKSRQSSNNMEEQAILDGNIQRLKVAVCTLTPSKIIFQPLEVTLGSRALRNTQFGGVERFLLVHFREEDNRQLRVTNDAIKQRLKNAMHDGIELFKKRFKYMGASTGQMKEMGFWFIDLPPGLKDITQAHNLLGKLSDIKNIATYIARVGQYFSTTWPIGIKLIEVKNKSDIRPNGESNYVLEIDDIKRNGYCFTDGVGKISWGLAGRIARKLKIPLSRKEDIPSAYQVRVAGCKGMVAIDPDSTLNDYYIHVRDSMIKFKSDDWNLEICEYARPMTLTLNNQVIRLLKDLGNSDDEFCAHQNQGFEKWVVPEEQQPSAIDIAAQKNASYSLSKDNLLTNRIPIPPKDGRNLFGIADETGVLKYGECFIQYSILDSTDNNERKFRVVTGTVIVTKNPCLWPGDFRRLTAVANRKLESCMRDVIVFPVHGDRPHSNEIAGSDLDGDQYWVYWGDRFTIKKNEEPLSYKGAKKSDIESNMTPELIINHIVESFGAGIILGMIAHTHTAVADKHEEHSFSEPCKKLAELFALAVDSPKTGKFVDKKEITPFQYEYCQEWPKFMRKFGERSYNSKSILEKLFCRAESKYYQLRENPMINVVPQKIRAIKGASMAEVQDKQFKKWLDGGIYEETTNRKKFPDNESDHDDSETPQQRTKNLTKLTTTDEKLQPKTKTPVKKLAEETQVKPKPASSSTQKKPADTENSSVLINSSAMASPAASLTSLNNDQCQPDFLIGGGTKIIASSGIQFCSDGNGFYVVESTKKTTDEPDNRQIIEKLTSYLIKQDVLKKKPSVYNKTAHGSLYLMIFYGHINFIEQNPFPKKFGELEKLIKENNNEFIRFRHATSDELNDPITPFSTTKKNNIDYEFDCYLSSSPSECFTLLYDKNKTLRKIRVYRIWSKCYIRQPDINVDSLCEIRSVITYDSDSLDFIRIRDSIFQTPSTGLLSGHKPNIKIDRTILRLSVIPVNLKVIEEDLPTDMEDFYRKVKYISINEQQDKPIVLSTMEYHVSTISKDEDVLGKVCSFALSLPKDVLSNRRYSTSSTASSMSDSLPGLQSFLNGGTNMFPF